MKKFRLSLNQKLIGIILIAFATIIVSLMISEYQSHKRENMRYMRYQIIQLSNVVQYGIMSLMLQDQCDSVPRFLMNSSQTIESTVNIFNPYTGAVISSSDAALVGKKRHDQDYEKYRASHDSEPIVVVDNRDLYMVRFLPIKNAESCYRCHPQQFPLLGIVKVKHNLNKFLLDAKNSMIQHIILSTLAVFVFALIFSYVVIKLINNPLDSIMETVNCIENGDLDKRVTIKNDDIIGKLAEQINIMTAKRKEASMELEKYHAMQVMRASQMASIGEMAACIAHDIKNPLACMSSTLQVIDGEMDERNENKLIIKEVIDQIGRIDDSVKKMLAYARPEEERQSTIDVDDLLEQALSLIDRLAGMKNVALNFFKGDGEKKVLGGVKALQQLFFNVCLNGIEAMEAGGSLTIASNIRNKWVAETKSRWVEVEIRDTGCGISDQNRALIFNPLFTTKEKGTGLGLAISARIVEQHRGFIQMESVVGKGTTFTIGLPAIAEG